MKLEIKISRQAIGNKDYTDCVKTKIGEATKERSTEALLELLNIIKKN